MMPIGFIGKDKATINRAGSSADLAQTFEDADASRLAGLQQSQVIQRARVATLQREQSRLADKYGKESPQVLAAAERVTAATAVAARLVADVARAGVAWFDVPDGVSIVHGFVIDPDFNGLAVEIQAQDEQGIIVGRSKTDGRGYFQLQFKISEKPDNQGTLFEGATVRLGVLDGGKLNQTDDQALPVGSGRAVYREVVIQPPEPLPVIR